jgi:DNA polymerase-3 subunit delta'
MSSVWDSVRGQTHAVDLLRQLTRNPVHGYLFIGPDGCGKDEAARAFASCLVTGSDDATSREARLIFQQSFTDVHEIRREGASILAEQAEKVIQLASRSTVESSVCVIILHEVHLMAEAAIVRLLKTLEEPPSHVRFILLADTLVPSLTTVASRCVNVHFGEMPARVIEDALLAEGVAGDLARAASLGASGSLARALLLARDSAFLERRKMFARIPAELDGSGHHAIALVDVVMEKIKDAAAPLEELFKEELAELEARIKISGERGSGRKDLEASQKRRLRKHLTDELRNGLAVVAGVYRDAMSHVHNAHRIGEFATAIDDIHTSIDRLALNANEELLLQALFLRLPVVRQTDLVG